MTPIKSALAIVAFYALVCVGAHAAGSATPLPADGGEPGKVYRAYNAAMIKGDLDAVAKYLSKGGATKLLAQRNDLQFKAMFGFIQQSQIHDPKIGKGSSIGDAATLEVSGKDGGGADTESTISLVRENGDWRVDHESSHSQMH